MGLKRSEMLLDHEHGQPALGAARGVQAFVVAVHVAPVLVGDAGLEAAAHIEQVVHAQQGFGARLVAEAVAALGAGDAEKTAESARAGRKYRLGLVAALPVSAGFWDLGLSIYKESNHNGIVGRDVRFDPTWSLTSAWSLAAGPGAFGGFLSVTGPKGRDGFKREGEMKMNTRVNAPAYLLRVNLAFVTEQIQKHGGTFSTAGNERSFYPYFFSPREEQGIIHRLLSIDEQQAH